MTGKRKSSQSHHDLGTIAAADGIPAGAAAWPNVERRAEPRFDFEVQPASVRIEPAPGRPVCHRVTPHNISPSGAGFTIATFLAPQTPCQFLITGADESGLEISGTVARCDHRGHGLFDAAVRFDQAIDLRRFVRLAAASLSHATEPAALIRTHTQHNRPMRWYVHPSRLDSKGMTFTHGRPFEPRQTCGVVLFNEHHQRIELTARVESSRQLGSAGHEIQITFDQWPIDSAPDPHDAQPPVGDSATRNTRRDVSDPIQINDGPSHGCASVLVVDEFDLDRHLLRALLTRLGLRVTDLAGLQSDRLTAPGAWSRFEVALVDIGAHRPAALQTIRDQRQAGFDGVVVAMSADERPDVRAAALAAGANAFLQKPFNHMQVHTLLERLLVGEQATHTPDATNLIVSSKRGDNDLSPLIDEFVANLPNHIASLHRAVDQADLVSLTSTCRLLQGAGAGYGFESVTHSAARTLDALDDPEPMFHEVQRHVRELIEILSRVRR